jgi:hypothetical protein
VIVAAPDFGERGNPTGATILARAHFDALPGTESEAQALHGLLPNARVLTHAAASEDALRGLRAPQILHVATHGFFLAAKPSVVNARTRGLELLPASNVPAEWTIDEPMLRSGLAFSGANQHHRGSNDGILTALEALSLDLTGTELVVLSACETGVGEATGGEGVYGLRRALLIAGAQTQVMSLWKIDDETTSRLMQGYYRAVVDGRGRAEALRDVQLSLARDSKYRHPYYWASFIVSGNPASLHGRSAGQVPTAQPAPRGCACDLVGGRSFRATSGHWLVGTLAALAALLIWRRQRAESRRGLGPAVSVLGGVTLLGACAASINPPPTTPHARQIALPSAPASAYLEAQEACTRGDAVQCYLLGLDEQTSGEDIANPGPEELARARPHFERGCALGDAASCGALAQYFSRCWQGCKDAEQRREEFTWYLYMERACDLGDPAPCAELGRLWHDEGFLRKAQLYFQRGCEAGGITSQQACEALNEQR